MSDASFVRFGGLAAILFAFTSWAAVVAFYTVAAGGEDVVGTQVYRFFYALGAVWSLFAIVAVYQRLRSIGEAWAFFATLVGLAGAVGVATASLYGVASLRLPTPPAGPSPANPFGVMTFGFASLWFLIVSMLLWRTPTPRRLALLGFVTAADLLLGFVASLAEIDTVTTLAGAFAGAVGEPLFWLWLGMSLRRSA